MTKQKQDIRVSFLPINVRSVEQLGNAIRRIRRLQKLSQIELAKKAGVTQATVSRLEAGVQKTEIHTLLLILAALGSDLRIAARPKTEPKNALEGLF